MVSGSRVFYSGCTGSCMLGGRGSMDQTCSSTSYRSDWDLGNVEARSTPWALYCVPRADSEQCLCCVRAHCPLPLGSVVVMRGCTWSTIVFGWVVHVKWHSHECQHSRFLSRTLHFEEIINVINVT